MKCWQVCNAHMFLWTGQSLVQLERVRIASMGNGSTVMVVVCSTPSHSLNQFWIIVNWTPRSTHGKALKTSCIKILAFFVRPQRVSRSYSYWWSAHKTKVRHLAIFFSPNNAIRKWMQKNIMTQGVLCSDYLKARFRGYLELWYTSIWI